MTVEAYTGLMGSGKTLALVEYGLKALSRGADIYANFGIGVHEWGYMDWDTGAFVSFPALARPRFRAWFEKEYAGVRIGYGFTPFPNVYRLRDWEHFCNLRVVRDPLGMAHRDGCDYRRCRGCSRGLLVMIDEVNSWANSRHWQDVGIGLLTKFTYIRKHGIELVVSAQHEARLDVALRHLLEFTWLCRSGGLWTARETDNVKQPVRFRGFPLAWFMRERFIAGQLSDSVRAGSKELDSHVGIVGGMAAERHWFSDKVADAYNTYEEVERPGTKKITKLIWRGERQPAA
jgi:hypothetical protein